jgi:hypothetical protein
MAKDASFSNEVSDNGKHNRIFDNRTFPRRQHA